MDTAEPTTMIAKTTGLKASWLMFICAIAIVFGAVSRFEFLDRKIFWNDEAMCAIVESGYGVNFINEHFFTNKVTPLAQLLAWENVNSGRPLSDTINLAAHEDPHNPPIFYVLTRGWTAVFGDSITTRRSLAALLGVLLIPAVYFLCATIAQSTTAGLIGAALVAVSPFQSLISQEAQGYSLWALSLAMANACLVRGLRHGRIADWVIYTLALGIGFYAKPLTVVMIVAHAVYVFCSPFVCKSKWEPGRVRAFLLSLIGAAILFSPWGLVLVTNLKQAQYRLAWLSQPVPFDFWMQNVALGLERVFVDFDALQLQWCLLPAIIFELVCLLVLAKRCTNQKEFFLLTAVLVPALCMFLPDLLFGGARSLVPRYSLPLYLMLEIAAACVLADCVDGREVLLGDSRHICGLLVLIIGAGIFSTSYILPKHIWWNKMRWDGPANNMAAEAAAAINQESYPIVVCGFMTSPVLTLSYMLKPNVELLGVPPGEMPAVPTASPRIFLFNPEASWLDHFNHGNEYKPEVVLNGVLWKLSVKVKDD
jgi:uncharacterized membrane protein